MTTSNDEGACVPPAESSDPPRVKLTLDRAITFGIRLAIGIALLIWVDHYAVQLTRIGTLTGYAALGFLRWLGPILVSAGGWIACLVVAMWIGAWIQKPVLSHQLDHVSRGLQSEIERLERRTRKLRSQMNAWKHDLDVAVTELRSELEDEKDDSDDDQGEVSHHVLTGGVKDLARRVEGLAGAQERQRERIDEIAALVNAIGYRTLSDNERAERRFEQGKPVTAGMLRKGSMLRLMHQDVAGDPLEVGEFHFMGWLFQEFVYRHRSVDNAQTESQHPIASGAARHVGTDSWEPYSFEVGGGGDEILSGGDEIRVVTPDSAEDEEEHRRLMIVNDEYRRGHTYPADNVQTYAWRAWRQGHDPDPDDATIGEWATARRNRLTHGRPEGPLTSGEIAAARPSNRSPWREKSDPLWHDHQGRRSSAEPAV